MKEIQEKRQNEVFLFQNINVFITYLKIIMLLD